MYWIPKTMSPQSFNLFRLICVFCERCSCLFGPSACLGRSALFFYPSHSPFLVEPICLISSCYFQLSFILLSSREKRKCSNAWCRCLSLSLLLLPLFVQRQIIHMLNGVVILKRVMKLTKWLISQKRGVVVVIRFYEWLSLSFFSFSVFVFRFHCTYMTEWL